VTSRICGTVQFMFASPPRRQHACHSSPSVAKDLDSDIADSEGTRDIQNPGSLLVAVRRHIAYRYGETEKTRPIGSHHSFILLWIVPSLVGYFSLHRERVRIYRNVACVRRRLETQRSVSPSVSPTWASPFGYLDIPYRVRRLANGRCIGVEKRP
jgi:hypothetical protein